MASAGIASLFPRKINHLAPTSGRTYAVRMSTEFEPNLDDEREVDLADEIEPPAPAPTLDPDEMVEQEDENQPAMDDEREA